MIDEEARKFIDEQYVRAQALLRDKRELLDVLANELLTKEVIFKDDLERLLGKRPFDKQETTESENTSGTTGNTDAAASE